MALSGERFVRWWVTPWGNWDLVCLWDATAQQQTGQSIRLMLGDLSHELRTPIATILTHLEVLRLPDLSEEQRQQFVGMMKIEARRLARMAHNLLELSYLETTEELERRPVDLLTLAEEMVAQTAPRADERGIAVTLETDSPLPLAVGAPDRLKQVFLNLLDNALKYSRPGDQVTITLEERPDAILCAVCDTGPGIPPQHLPYVTRRFYRGASESSPSGSGLGLALVEEILRHHSSRLEIASQAEGPKTGTCVQFTLPTLLEGEI